MTRRSKGDGSISSYRLASGEIRWRCQWYEPRDPMNPHLGKASCSARHTPASVHSRSRRQHVIPDTPSDERPAPTAPRILWLSTPTRPRAPGRSRLRPSARGKVET